MHPAWLSNAYLVADREGGTGVFVDSGAPLEPLHEAVDPLTCRAAFLALHDPPRVVHERRGELRIAAHGGELRDRGA